ncbi:uncharacterized protein BDZ83DRAFT_217798 [Colletotrichum acutatum]|uniref:Uncharacterized protein n=1 Tax=Glomerella acutata TaxID=27357 RepID=A0AAD8XJ39_GLOAC|nr:uncharacterized protein BDZ83DRAFT_217798 [Colletotrichum acutatum]KAK1727153.1 hypothetical protein BDZ83DRAFT_217798 [Colletotrichum acutatum]
MRGINHTPVHCAELGPSYAQKITIAGGVHVSVRRNRIVPLHYQSHLIERVLRVHKLEPIYCDRTEREGSHIPGLASQTRMNTLPAPRASSSRYLTNAIIRNIFIDSWPGRVRRHRKVHRLCKSRCLWRIIWTELRQIFPAARLTRARLVQTGCQVYPTGR